MHAKQTIAIAAAAIATSFFVGACVTYTQSAPQTATSRGLKPSHAAHAELELDCTLCHEPQEDSARLTLPSHDLCTACHEFDLDNPVQEQCMFCHTREDYTVEPRATLLSEELKWTHDPHTAAEVNCATCHENVDEGFRPAQGFKKFCMDCHAQTGPELNECSVCHTQLSMDSVPMFRGDVRIAHDSPAIWTQVHGREAQADPAYCAICHTNEQQFCNECHTTTAPANHTVAWARRTHGIQAGWDRQSCAVCHEEESCLQCHRNVEPASHRSGWGRPLDRHCENCHFPPTQTGCVVCHESTEHISALPSPHRVNIYPANCALCHPGGRPTNAPHPTNSSVSCRFCH